MPESTRAHVLVLLRCLLVAGTVAAVACLPPLENKDDTGPVDLPEECVDEDGDGFGTGGSGDTCAGSELDCNDGDARIYPGADETCDGLDNDCDGAVDDDPVDGDTWYPDSDGDGFGDDGSATVACAVPSGAVAEAGDCDDGDASIHPGVDEHCDGVDEDCDGDVDEDAVDPLTWYADSDGDGYGDDEAAVEACEAPTGSVAAASDCDDSDASIHPGADEHCDDVDEDCDDSVDEGAVDPSTWYADGDGDGYGDPDSAVEACEAPTSTVADSSDCDDGDASIHPGADEHCDGVDEDCDGSVDEEGLDPVTWYTDADGDGYGDAGSSSDACIAPSGTVADSSDCDDGDATVNPSADEYCDGVDEDCDGSVDEEALDATTWYADMDGDGYGRSGMFTQACAAPSGWLADSTDCDDSDAAVNPGADEYCDGVDEDCDGSVDEEALDATTWYADMDGDGYGRSGMFTQACTAPSGWLADASDCDDGDVSIHPGADEHCDGVDEDCDGSTDEAAVDPSTWYADADGDGYGDSASSTAACRAPTGTVADASDCNDGDATIFPGADEYCDGVDEDCDGAVDEAALDADTWYPDLDADGYGDPVMATSSCSAPWGYILDGSDCDDGDAGVNPAADELCNGVDDDCDGTVDTVNTVSFEDGSGNISDVSSTFTGGTATTPLELELEDSGSYAFCSGTWYLSLSISAPTLSLAGPHGAADAILSGGLIERVILVESGATSLSLEGLGLQDGDADKGAALRSEVSGMVIALQDCVVSDHAATDGGALYLKNGSISIQDTELVDNLGTGNGGALYAESSEVELHGGSLTGNLAKKGGAAYLKGSDMLLSDSAADSNLADEDGGAFYLDSSWLWAVDSELSGNDAVDDGGAVYVSSSLFECEADSSGAAVLERNLAGLFGGAVYVAGLSASYGATVVSTGCGWGTSSDDNGPDDLRLTGSGTSYIGFGAAETFTCDASSCM